MTEPQLSNSPPQQPLVIMRFRPAWTYIDGIREFGEFFCQATFGVPEVAARACVIIQETLENAIKYSSVEMGDELELEISASQNRIEFSVTSTPDRQHLDSLKAELDLLNSSDPETAFINALERAEKQPEASARLGLARMRYEGCAELKVREVSGGRIRFTARGTL